MSSVANSASKLVEFVDFSLGCGERSDISLILARIATDLGCYGAILWESDPEIRSTDENARLFTAGQWFRDGKQFASHTLKVRKSFVGQAILTGMVQMSNRLGSDLDAAHSRAAKEFYAEHGICCCRVAAVRSADGAVAALALYRQLEDGPFAIPDRGDDPLVSYCQLLPGIQQALHHKVSLGLIDDVKTILQEPGVEDQPDTAMQKVCTAISEHLGVLEASVFAADPASQTPVFRLRATTCQGYIGQPEYRAGEAGLTSWVLTNKRPLRIWDLLDFYLPAEKEMIERRYKGIVWRDPIDARRVATELLKTKEIPPLSFFAEPILAAKNVVGVLRTCTIVKPPRYFTTRERLLLAVIAGQLGQFWSRQAEHKLVVDENLAWRTLVSSLNRLSFSLNSELRKQRPDVKNVLSKGLEATADLIPGGDISDIRLHDPKTNELFFALWKGQGWTQERLSYRFQVGKKPPESYGAKVFQTGEMVVVNPDDHPIYRKVFPDAKALMIVPIGSPERKYGVIDIRTLLARPFPEHSIQIAQLLGNQFGMFYALVESFAELRSQERALKELTDTTIKAFADWQHQIRGPINQALLRLKDVLKQQYPSDTSVPPYLWIQRGLLAKAHRATRSLQLFINLSNGQPLILRMAKIGSEDLRKRLIETCLDNRILASSRRVVEFDVKADTFEMLDALDLIADMDLIEQAVNNVIDNAFKYSYLRKKIEISGSDAGKYFRLTVSNEGIPLLASDLGKLGTRGFRGDLAESVVGEGSGIGLWVVRNILEAHGGRLIPEATSNGRTSIHLELPWA